MKSKTTKTTSTSSTTTTTTILANGKHEHKIELLNENFSKIKLSISSFFTYSTTRSATIKSFKIGITYRVVQFLLFYYIVGWELIGNKAYQKLDTVSSCLRIRVKGDGLVPLKSDDYQLKLDKNDPDYYRKLFEFDPNIEYRMIDPADYIIPPNEYNSVFIMTKFIKTEQSYGYCDRKITKKHCDENVHGNGSKCYDMSVIPNNYKKKILAWCPIETELVRDEENLIRNVLNYTVFIRNNVEFKMFNVKLRNLRKEHNERFIRECANYPVKTPSCPVFTLEQILSEAEKNETERYLMLLKGTAIEAQITWDCDLDFKKPDECYPKYIFKTINLPFKTTMASNGYSIWYADHYKVNGVEYRTLFKAFGIRIIINVTGTAGKFDLVPLMLTIGAGLGLMSISVIVAECVMLNCSRNKKKYQEIKEYDYNIDDLKNDKENIKVARV